MSSSNEKAKGLSCPTAPEITTPTPVDYGNLAKSMGLSQQCVKNVTTIATANKSSSSQENFGSSDISNMFYDTTCCNKNNDASDPNSCLHCYTSKDYGTVSGGVKVGDPASFGSFCKSSRVCGEAKDIRWTCADIWTANTTVSGEICTGATEAGVFIENGSPIGSVSVMCRSLNNKVWTDSRFNGCIAGASKLKPDQINAYKRNLNLKNYEAMKIKNDGKPAAGPTTATPAQTKKATALDNKLQSTGCGQFFVNANTVHNNTNIINCAISNNTTNQNVTVTNTGSIKITTNLTPEMQQQKTDAINELNETQRSLYALGSNPNVKPKILKLLIDANESLQETYRQLYSTDINITDSSITVTAATTVKTVSQIQDNISDEVVSAYHQVANATAQQNLLSKLGTNALSPNVKSFMINDISNNNNQVNTHIKNIVNNSTASANGSTGITINAFGSVNITGSTIKSDSVINMISDMISKSAMALGQKTTLATMSKATSMTKSEAQSAGLDALQEALNKEAGDDSESDTKKYIIYGIIAVIVIILLIGAFMFFKGSGKTATASGSKLKFKFK